MVKKERQTKETKIAVELNIYGDGVSEIDSGVGFFNHMLEAFSKHAWMDLKLKCAGDTHIDDHHSVEDCGIVLGEVLNEAIFPVRGVERYGDGVVVMDEAAVACAIDLSGRGMLVFEADMKDKIGSFDSELIKEFFNSVATNAKITVHITQLRGQNSHHIAEAIFKSFAVALRRAITKNERAKIPSTKGIL